MAGRPAVLRQKLLEQDIQAVDRIHRVQLQQTAFGRSFDPIDITGLEHLPPHLTRALAVSPLGHGHCGERSEPAWGAGKRARAAEPVRRTLIVAHPPVVHESDIVRVLPAVWLMLEAAFQQCDGQIWATGTGRVGFGEENGTEPIGDAEARVERRREVEQGIEQVEVLLAFGATLAAVVHDGTHPVQVRDEVSESQRQRRRQARADPQHRIRRVVGTPTAVAHHLHASRHAKEAGSGQEQRRDRRSGGGVGARHLKSRRRKIAMAAMSSTPI
ncbi:MAG: hypothetical protein LC791_13450 [Acidobacteria bacterium]|nr:hypothetical protein [Acidobacteriota bacterium]